MKSVQRYGDKTVGSGYTLSWSIDTAGRLALQKFLTNNPGAPGVLLKTAVNPTISNIKTSGSAGGGTLATQTATLTINVAFSKAGYTSNGFNGFGNLVYNDPTSSLNHQTINQILGASNTALGGGGLPSGYTYSTLNQLVTNLNQGFENGVPTTWALTYLTVA